MKLKDKVAIVTGAGSGIGRAITIAFITQEAMVTAVDISQQGLDSLVTEAGERAGHLLLKLADATVKFQISDVVQETLGKWGRLDILVNNVGGGLGSFAGSLLADEEWDKTLVLNLTGNYLLTQTGRRANACPEVGADYQYLFKRRALPQQYRSSEHRLRCSQGWCSAANQNGSSCAWALWNHSQCDRAGIGTNAFGKK
jgi:NAD(P)-dependent dehydrogenase (short-subunit alcohol dehydrogenase family)